MKSPPCPVCRLPIRGLRGHATTAECIAALCGRLRIIQTELSRERRLRCALERRREKKLPITQRFLHIENRILAVEQRLKFLLFSPSNGASNGTLAATLHENRSRCEDRRAIEP